MNQQRVDIGGAAVVGGLLGVVAGDISEDRRGPNIGLLVGAGGAMLVAYLWNNPERFWALVDAAAALAPPPTNYGGSGWTHPTPQPPFYLDDLHAAKRGLVGSGAWKKSDRGRRARHAKPRRRDATRLRARPADASRQLEAAPPAPPVSPEPPRAEVAPERKKARKGRVEGARNAETNRRLAAYDAQRRKGKPHAHALTLAAQALSNGHRAGFKTLRQGLERAVKKYRNGGDWPYSEGNI